MLKRGRKKRHIAGFGAPTLRVGKSGRKFKTKGTARIEGRWF